MTGPQTYVEYLQALLSETERLHGAAADEDWEQVLSCLEARQALMDQIDALPAARLAEADYPCADGLLDQIQNLDREVAPKVLTALETTRAAIEESRLTRSTIHAYRRTSYGHPQAATSRFIDKQR